MFVKQLKVLDGNQVKETVFTSDEQVASGVLKLLLVTQEQVKNGCKMPPYTRCDKKTMNLMFEKQSVFKKMLGASNAKSYKNTEQYVGVIDVAEYNLPVPVISCVYLYKSHNELMMYGKIIADLNDRRCLYAMLKRLSEMQKKNNAIGILKGRAMTEDNAVEMLCDFSVSVRALQQLSKEGFGFVINTVALQNFDYKLAGIAHKEVAVEEEREFIVWCAKHNKQDIFKIKGS